MSIPACFINILVDGEKMNVWRPKEEVWIKEPVGSIDPTWKQIIRELCLKPFCPRVSDMDDKVVKFNLVQIRMLTKHKPQELFSLEIEEDETSFELHLRLFALEDDNYIKFEVNETGIEVSLPWEDGYDFEYVDEKLNHDEKKEIAIAQALHYVGIWFENEMSFDVLLDAEEVDDSNNDDSDNDDEKDYTFMDPWIFKLPSKVSVKAHCIKHDEAITFKISEHKKKRKIGSSHCTSLK